LVYSGHMGELRQLLFLGLEFPVSILWRQVPHARQRGARLVQFAHEGRGEAVVPTSLEPQSDFLSVDLAGYRCAVTIHGELAAILFERAIDRGRVSAEVGVEVSVQRPERSAAVVGAASRIMTTNAASNFVISHLASSSVDIEVARGRTSSTRSVPVIPRRCQPLALYRLSGTSLVADCVSTHWPLMRTTQVPTTRLPRCTGSGRNPMSFPEITIGCGCCP
jgi:hypothetical protein